MSNENFDNDLPQNLLAPQTDPSLPPIYTPRAILVFSVVFAAVFGGVMMSLNLFRVGMKRPAWVVLLASAIFTAAEIWVVNLPENTIGTLALFLNLGGGLVLSKIVFPRYFPDGERHPRRKVWGALVVSILISLPFLVAAIWAASMGL